MKSSLLSAASAVLGAALLLSGCSKGRTEAASRPAGEATFDPVPADPDNLEAQLKRYKGQTKFLNPYTRYGDGKVSPSAASRADSAGSGRAIQESDIFKLGKPGSKLLFLLNNYRGLQVVSFADGADQPKLLGRAPATGNWPDAMYYDAARDRLLVLENVYESQDGDYYDYSEIQARLLTYDVSTPETPTLVKTEELKGTLAESRLVGGVLYVATSVRPNWYERSTQTDQTKGFVYSFDLTAAQPTLVQTQELSDALTWGNQMNVVEVQEGDATKYYLIATLSEDAIEVVDISDAKGVIKPVMVVSAKGFVRERSQTLIKNRTLVVASNFSTEGATPLQRIAVETFKFPEAHSETIDETEAAYRTLYIERAVAKKEKELIAAGVSGDALIDQLKAFREERLSDAELGLKGRFIRGSSGILRKGWSDSVVTVGSTQGLHASLQDVRASGNQLYVYWVPANNIDPLDVFDLTAPENGVRHLAHLEFDGWIQRAIPISYQGRQYVMGLGWIIPSVDNDTNRRYPQAVLFEIRAHAGHLRAEVVAQKNLGASSTWADFNAEDKMIEVRFTGEGVGALLYTFSSWDGTTYLNGGKLIGFDASKVDTAPDQVFVEGAVLKGDEGWLRRVFTNVEIGRVNTFSDQALGVFDLGGAIGAAGAIADATATLELARNVRSYASLTKDGAVRGIQIISDYGWWGREDAGTELRLVAADRADAEKGAALATVKVPGQFVGSLAKDGALLVLTERYARTGDASTWTWKIDYFVHRLSLASASELRLDSSATWEVGHDAASGPRLGWQQKLVSLASGKVLAATSRGVKAVVVTADGLGVEALPFANCVVEGAEEGNLMAVGGRLYVEHSVVVHDPAIEDLSYVRNFAAAYDEASGTCAAVVNVPGHLLNVADGAAVTSDTRFIDRVQRGSGDHTYYEVVTESALAALTLDPSVAKLRDLYDPKDVSVEQMQVFDGDRLVFIESTATRSWWGGIGVSDVVRPFPRGTRTEQRFTILGLDDEQSFTKQAWQLTLPLSSAAQLKGLLTLGRESLAVVGQGRHLAVLGFDGQSRPTPKTLRKISASFEPEAETKVVTLEGYGWYWYGDQALHLTEAQRTLEVPQGLFGVAQLQIVD